jgi:NADH-quinone oxidoreductase subunit D
MTYNLYFGPIHPALKEPINFTFEIEGERIVNVKPNIGYNHRGLEKLLESKTWLQSGFVAEHICGICSGAHNGCCYQGVERIFGIEPPRRGLFIRTLVWELERIHSHLLWLGVMLHESGFDTVFMYCWRDRELTMDLFEEMSGRRVVYSMNTVGGVRRDITDSFLDKLKKYCNYLEERAKFYEDLITGDTTILARLQGVAPLSKSDAAGLSAVGPVARASGVKRDVRYEEPYAVYDESPFRIILREEGDALARTIVRIEEIKVSIDILRWIADKIPQGDYKIKFSPITKAPENKAISRIEAPRGELFYYFKSDGGTTPSRVKVRTPTFANILPVVKMLEGQYIADIPIAVASIDPCIACCERVTLIDRRTENTTIVTMDQLRSYSKKYYKKAGGEKF